jgi:hypothetical protein
MAQSLDAESPCCARNRFKVPGSAEALKLATFDAYPHSTVAHGYTEQAAVDGEALRDFVAGGIDAQHGAGLATDCRPSTALAPSG